MTDQMICPKAKDCDRKKEEITHCRPHEKEENCPAACKGEDCTCIPYEPESELWICDRAGECDLPGKYSGNHWCSAKEPFTKEDDMEACFCDHICDTRTYIPYKEEKPMDNDQICAYSFTPKEEKPMEKICLHCGDPRGNHAATKDHWCPAVNGWATTTFKEAETMEKEYETLKPITLKAVYQAQGDKDCNEFILEMGRVFCSLMKRSKDTHSTFNWGASEKMFEILFPSLNDKAIQYLIDHGFIRERVVEVTYYIGDRFDHNNGEDIWQILPVAARSHEVELVRTENKNYTMGHIGERYSSSFVVKNPSAITKEEFSNFCSGPPHFTKIEE